MRLKKTVLMILCVLLCISAFGCGTKKSDDNQNNSAQQTEQSDKPDNKDSSDKNGKSADSAKAADKSAEGGADAGQAPVIESGEELKSMVDEFNNTDDPEKKEELRKKLEAFLNQAEQQSEASTTENK